MRLLAIDPGKHKYGWAVLEDKVIVAAGWEDSYSLPELDDYGFDRIIFEWPQVYPDQKRTDPNDLLDLTYTLGMVHKMLERKQPDIPFPERVLPRTWKKQVKKHIHNKRALKRMTDAEKKIVGTNNNVIDAAALGIWAAGRWYT